MPTNTNNNTMKKVIQFDTSAGKAPIIPAATTGGFRSIVFRDELFKLKKSFNPDNEKPYWLRFLPPIQGTKFQWMLRLNLFTNKAGVTFVSPTTFDERAADPFAQAQKWLRKNKPEVLANRETNPDGFRLWPTPYGISWIVDDNAEAGSRLSLYLASLYDGSRGGTQGVAHRIKSLAEEKDSEPGSATKGELLHGDIIEPGAGRLIKMSVSKSGGFNSYDVGVGSNPSPVAAHMENLTEEELSLIAPLEEVVYVPTVEEIHGFLKEYIGADLHAEIFPNL